MARVSLEPPQTGLPQAKNEEVLEEYGEILYSRANLGIRGIQSYSNDDEEDEEDEVQLFDEKDDYELAHAVEEGLITLLRQKSYKWLCECSLYSSSRAGRHVTRYVTRHVESQERRLPGWALGTPRRRPDRLVFQCVRIRSAS